MKFRKKPVVIEAMQWTGSPREIDVAGDPVIACGEGCLRLTEVSMDDEPCPEQARYLVGRSVRGRLR